MNDPQVERAQNFVTSLMNDPQVLYLIGMSGENHVDIVKDDMPVLHLAAPVFDGADRVRDESRIFDR